MNASSIRQFYDELNFPGPYTRQALDYHRPRIRNQYIQLIDGCVTAGQTILDVGCGTGLITNLLALRYPDKQFTAIDFSRSLDWAEDFRHRQHIQNVRFQKVDFLEWHTDQRFDCVICQGVLHHMPDTHTAAKKLSDLVKPGGRLLVAVYHPWGKILKRFVHLDYRNHILHRDQEQHPFELTFEPRTLRRMFPELDFQQQWPRHPIWHAVTRPISFSRNGGLVAYILQKNMLS